MEYAVLFLPLLGAIFGYLAKFFGDLTSQLITTFLVCISAVLSIILFYNGIFHDTYGNHLIYQWIASGSFVVDWSMRYYA